MIGAPLYNHADFLPAALDSLLAQTDPDFVLLLIDDLSDDDTPEIARTYAERDPRVSVHHNESRLGLVGNWRRCFELARELCPDAEFFAWGSDHDLWHPRWLATMVSELERHPEAAIAYPTCERITAQGQVSQRRGGFHTVGVPHPGARLRLSHRGMHAGDVVYGLIRTHCLERAGVFRHVMEPDRLLMAELALQGECRHVGEPLWQRRFVQSAARARQRRAIFPRRPPLYSWLPPWIVRPMVFLWIYAIRGAGAPHTSRRHGLVLAITYALATVEQVARRRWALLRKRARRLRKELARARKRARRRRARIAAQVTRNVRLGARRWGHARKSVLRARKTARRRVAERRRASDPRRPKGLASSQPADEPSRPPGEAAGRRQPVGQTPELYARRTDR